MINNSAMLVAPPICWRSHCAVLVLLANSSVFGQTESPSPKTLLVATRHVPPFVIKGQDGTWSGITVELWETIAAQLELEYSFVEVDLDEMVDGLANNRFDVTVAALTMTAVRESQVDFTHPFFDTGLAIAVLPKGSTGLKGVFSRLLSMRFFQAVAALGGLLLAVGVAVWLCERRRNPEQFGGKAAKGVGSGFWWSAVTMTTVGYGDKAPVTLLGRIIALGWMFASIIVISSFTAAIASALTVSQLDTGIQGPEDLPGLTVATVSASTSEAYLRKRRINVTPYATPLEAMEAVATGEVDAAVYDDPVLRYVARHEMEENIRVLPRTFAPQNYAIALPADSPLREPMNRIILQETSSAEWQDVIYRFLGEAEF